MIAEAFDYESPATLQEALALLAGGNGKPLAGGMTLIPLMKLRLATPERLVNIARLPDLNFMREEGGQLHIGATTTHYRIETSPTVRLKCPLLADTAARIGDVQVRNMGTLGGSLAHADPAADYPAALVALEAQVHLLSAHSDRTLPIGEFLVDAMTTALEPGELVFEVILPVEEPRTSVWYEKVAHPASGFAVVGVAVRIRKGSNGRIGMARIGITGLGAKAFRANASEELLEGAAGTPLDIEKAAAVAADGVEPNSDLYASADYRRHLTKVTTARAITHALARMG